MTTPTSATPLRYPAPPTSDQVDDFHGTLVHDPYRPLEDSDAPGDPGMDPGTERAHRGRPRPASGAGRDPGPPDGAWDYPRAGAPWRRGNRWFQLRNTGLQDQDVLWTAPAPDAEGKVLFDPNELSAEGTTSLSDVAVFDEGEDVALALSHAGSDWRRWRVRSADTGEELPDRVDWSKFASAAWTKDGAGFFYGCYPEPAAGPATRPERRHGASLPPAENRRGGRSAGLRDPGPSRLGLRAGGLRRRRAPDGLTSSEGTDLENQPTST